MFFLAYRRPANLCVSSRELRDARESVLGNIQDYFEPNPFMASGQSEALNIHAGSVRITE